jgi:high-affinity iron transporter
VTTGSARRNVAGIGAFAVLVGALAAHGAESDSAQRLFALVRGVEREYAEAFDETGHLIRPIELEEAALLLADARKRAREIAGGSDVVLAVDGLADAVGAKAPRDAVAARARAIRALLEATTGAHERFLPEDLPSAARGAALYAENCASCHGASGRGDGPAAERLERRPADFTDPAFMREQTPDDFFLVISLGRRGAAMPGWEDSLSVEERWDLVAYVWSLGDVAATSIEEKLRIVERKVSAAIDAYRLHEEDARTLASDAYLAFEPLEPRIAARDPAVVRRVEAEFLRLQRALARDSALREADDAAAAVMQALAAVRPSVENARADDRKPSGAAAIARDGAIGAGVLALFSVALWRARRR